MNAHDFEQKLTPIQDRINRLLIAHLPDSEQKLHQAMRYACLNGGKRIRAFLVYATADAYNTPWQSVDKLALAIELIHAYSLVHDDLPAMDNDDLRRGKPTCHKAYDEATAILVGDALLTYAFELLSKPQTAYLPQQQLSVIYELSQAIGLYGMVLGQALDMANTDTPISDEQIFQIHQTKTGALIQACVTCSALICGESDNHKLAILSDFGKAIGLAYQIQDDILDVTGLTKALGKQSGKDQQDHKNTFVSLFGLETAQQKATDYIKQALQSLKGLNITTDSLSDIAQFCVKRGF